MTKEEILQAIKEMSVLDLALQIIRQRNDLVDSRRRQQIAVVQGD